MKCVLAQARHTTGEWWSFLSSRLSASHGSDSHRIHQSALATVTIATAIEINSIVKCPIVQSPD
jgi:hypothetical protein